MFLTFAASFLRRPAVSRLRSPSPFLIRTARASNKRQPAPVKSSHVRPPSQPAAAARPPNADLRTVLRRNTGIIYAVMGANVAVFAWLVGRKAVDLNTSKTQGVETNAAFVSAVGALALNNKFWTTKPWTVITSSFTHADPTHLFCNMLALYAFGTTLAQTAGITPMLVSKLVLMSAVCASSAWLISSAFFRHDPCLGLGASGVVMGVGTVAACLHPSERVLLMMVVPVPLGLLIPAYFLYDAFYLNDATSRVGHGGHLGGVLYGLYFFVTHFKNRHAGMMAAILGRFMK